MERDTVAGRIERLADAIARRAQELVVDAELARVADLHVRMLRLEGVEHRGDVVLGVAGREEHSRNREAELVAAGVELPETLPDDGRRELQEAALDVVAGQAHAYSRGHRLELRDRLLVAASVAAHHHPDPAHRPPSPSPRPRDRTSG